MSKPLESVGAVGQQPLCLWETPAPGGVDFAM